MVPGDTQAWQGLGLTCRNRNEQNIGSVGQWGMRESLRHFLLVWRNLLVTWTLLLDTHLSADYCLARLQAAGMEVSKIRAW